MGTHLHIPASIHLWWKDSNFAWLWRQMNPCDMHNQQHSACPKLGWVKQQLIFIKRRRQCPRHTCKQARMKCNASSSPETPDLLMLDFRTSKMLRGTNKQSHLPGSSSFTFFSSLGLQQHVHCLHMHCHAICQLNTVHFQTYKSNLPCGQQQLLIPNPKFKTQNSYNSCPGNIASSWQPSGGNKNKRDKLSHLIRVSIAVVLTRIVGDCPAWMYPWEAISGDGHHLIPYQINHKTRHEFLHASKMRNVQWSWWELDRGHGCAHPGMYPRSLSNCSAIITSSLSISTTIGSLFTLDKDGIWQA